MNRMAADIGRVHLPNLRFLIRVRLLETHYLKVPAFLIDLNKIFNRAVICFFRISREVTGRELSACTVIPDALATNTHPRATPITTVTVFRVFNFIDAVHISYS